VNAPVIVHVMGWQSQQHGSFERFLVATRVADLGSLLADSALLVAPRDAGALAARPPPSAQRHDSCRLAPNARARVGFRPMSVARAAEHHVQRYLG
jgi:hypothetical protein